MYDPLALQRAVGSIDDPDSLFKGKTWADVGTDKSLTDFLHKTLDPDGSKYGGDVNKLKEGFLNDRTFRANSLTAQAADWYKSTGEMPHQEKLEGNLMGRLYESAPNRLVNGTWSEAGQALKSGLLGATIGAGPEVTGGYGGDLALNLLLAPLSIANKAVMAGKILGKEIIQKGLAEGAPDAAITAAKEALPGIATRVSAKDAAIREGLINAPLSVAGDALEQKRDQNIGLNEGYDPIQGLFAAGTGGVVGGAFGGIGGALAGRAMGREMAGITPTSMMKAPQEGGFPLTFEGEQARLAKERADIAAAEQAAAVTQAARANGFDRDAYLAQFQDVATDKDAVSKSATSAAGELTERANEISNGSFTDTKYQADTVHQMAAVLARIGGDPEAAIRFQADRMKAAFAGGKAEEMGLARVESESLYNLFKWAKDNPTGFDETSKTIPEDLVALLSKRDSTLAELVGRDRAAADAAAAKAAGVTAPPATKAAPQSSAAPAAGAQSSAAPAAGATSSTASPAATAGAATPAGTQPQGAGSPEGAAAAATPTGQKIADVTPLLNEREAASLTPLQELAAQAQTTADEIIGRLDAGEAADVVAADIATRAGTELPQANQVIATAAASVKRGRQRAAAAPAPAPAAAAPDAPAAEEGAITAESIDAGIRKLNAEVQQFREAIKEANADRLATTAADSAAATQEEIAAASANSASVEASAVARAFNTLYLGVTDQLNEVVRVVDAGNITPERLVELQADPETGPLWTGVDINQLATEKGRIAVKSQMARIARAAVSTYIADSISRVMPDAMNVKHFDQLLALFPDVSETVRRHASEDYAKMVRSALAEEVGRLGSVQAVVQRYGADVEALITGIQAKGKRAKKNPNVADQFAANQEAIAGAENRVNLKAIIETIPDRQARSFVAKQLRDFRTQLESSPIALSPDLMEAALTRRVQTALGEYIDNDWAVKNPDDARRLNALRSMRETNSINRERALDDLKASGYEDITEADLWGQIINVDWTGGLGGTNGAVFQNPVVERIRPGSKWGRIVQGRIQERQVDGVVKGTSSPQGVLQPTVGNPWTGSLYANPRRVVAATFRARDEIHQAGIARARQPSVAKMGLNAETINQRVEFARMQAIINLQTKRAAETISEEDFARSIEMIGDRSRKVTVDELAVAEDFINMKDQLDKAAAASKARMADVIDTLAAGGMGQEDVVSKILADSINATNKLGTRLMSAVTELTSPPMSKVEKVRAREAARAAKIGAVPGDAPAPPVGGQTAPPPPSKDDKDTKVKFGDKEVDITNVVYFEGNRVFVAGKDVGEVRSLGNGEYDVLIDALGKGGQQVRGPVNLASRSMFKKLFGDEIRAFDPATPRPVTKAPELAVWSSKDVDIPVTKVDEPPQAGPDGKMYQKVIGPEGKESFVPADELRSTSAPKPTKPNPEPEAAVSVKTADGTVRELSGDKIVLDADGTITLFGKKVGTWTPGEGKTKIVSLDGYTGKPMQPVVDNFDLAKRKSFQKHVSKLFEENKGELPKADERVVTEAGEVVPESASRAKEVSDAVKEVGVTALSAEQMNVPFASLDLPQGRRWALREVVNGKMVGETYRVVTERHSTPAQAVGKSLGVKEFVLGTVPIYHTKPNGDKIGIHSDKEAARVQFVRYGRDPGKASEADLARMAVDEKNKGVLPELLAARRGPISMEKLAKIPVGLSDQIATAADLVKAFDQLTIMLPVESIKGRAAFDALVTQLEMMATKIAEIAPHGVDNPTVGRATAVHWLKTHLKAAHPDDLSAALQFLRRLDVDPRGMPFFAEGTYDSFNLDANAISLAPKGQITDPSGQLLVPRHISVIHEVAHWAFKNILSPAERVEFVKSLAKYFDDGVFNKDKFFADMPGAAEIEQATGKALNGAREFTNELFAWQFTSFYLQKVRGGDLPGEQSLWQKVVHYLKNVLSKMMGGKIDPDLIPLFERIMPSSPIEERFNYDALRDLNNDNKLVGTSEAGDDRHKMALAKLDVVKKLDDFRRKLDEHLLDPTGFNDAGLANDLKEAGTYLFLRLFPKRDRKTGEFITNDIGRRLSTAIFRRSAGESDKAAEKMFGRSGTGLIMETYRSVSGLDSTNKTAMFDPSVAFGEFVDAIEGGAPERVLLANYMDDPEARMIWEQEFKAAYAQRRKEKPTATEDDVLDYAEDQAYKAVGEAYGVSDSPAGAEAAFNSDNVIKKSTDFDREQALRNVANDVRDMLMDGMDSLAAYIESKHKFAVARNKRHTPKVPDSQPNPIGKKVAEDVEREINPGLTITEEQRAAAMAQWARAYERGSRLYRSGKTEEGEALMEKASRMMSAYAKIPIKQEAAAVAPGVSSITRAATSADAASMVDELSRLASDAEDKMVETIRAGGDWSGFNDLKGRLQKAANAIDGISTSLKELETAKANPGSRTPERLKFIDDAIAERLDEINKTYERATSPAAEPAPKLAIDNPESTIIDLVKEASAQTSAAAAGKTGGDAMAAEQAVLGRYYDAVRQRFSGITEIPVINSKFSAMVNSEDDIDVLKATYKEAIADGDPSEIAAIESRLREVERVAARETTSAAPVDQSEVAMRLRVLDEATRLESMAPGDLSPGIPANANPQMKTYLSRITHRNPVYQDVSRRLTYRLFKLLGIEEPTNADLARIAGIDAGDSPEGLAVGGEQAKKMLFTIRELTQMSVREVKEDGKLLNVGDGAGVLADMILQGRMVDPDFAQRVRAAQQELADVGTKKINDVVQLVSMLSYERRITRNKDDAQLMAKMAEETPAAYAIADEIAKEAKWVIDGAIKPGKKNELHLGMVGAPADRGQHPGMAVRQVAEILDSLDDNMLSTVGAKLGLSADEASRGSIGRMVMYHQPGKASRVGRVNGGAVRLVSSPDTGMPMSEAGRLVAGLTGDDGARARILLDGINDIDRKMMDPSAGTETVRQLTTKRNAMMKVLRSTIGTDFSDAAVPMVVDTARLFNLGNHADRLPLAMVARAYAEKVGNPEVLTTMSDLVRSGDGRKLYDTVVGAIGKSEADKILKEAGFIGTRDDKGAEVFSPDSVKKLNDLIDFDGRTVSDEEMFRAPMASELFFGSMFGGGTKTNSAGVQSRAIAAGMPEADAAIASKTMPGSKQRFTGKEVKRLERFGGWIQISENAQRMRKVGAKYLADLIKPLEGIGYFEVRDAFLGKILSPAVRAIDSISGPENAVGKAVGWASDGRLTKWFSEVHRNAAVWMDGVPQSAAESRIVAAMRLGDAAVAKLSSQEKAVANQLRTYFQTALKAQRDAGLKVGDVTGGGRGSYYLPQRLNIDKLEKDTAEAIEAFARFFHNEGKSGDTIELARERAAKMVHHAIDDWETGGYLGGSSYARSFGEANYQRILNAEDSDQMRLILPFLDNNLKSLVVGYGQSAANRIEISKRFGLGGHVLNTYLTIANEGQSAVKDALLQRKTFQPTKVAQNYKGKSVSFPEDLHRPLTDDPEQASQIADQLNKMLSGAGNPTSLKKAAVDYLTAMYEQKQMPGVENFRKTAEAIVNAMSDYTVRGAILDGREAQWMEGMVHHLAGRPAYMSGLSGPVRNAAGAMMMFNNVSLLSMSVLASIPDLGMSLVRSGSFKAWGQSLLKNTVEARNYDSAFNRALRDLGVTIESVLNENITNAHGGKVGRLSNAFFWATGLTPWTNTMREVAATTGYFSIRANQEMLQRMKSQGQTDSVKYRRGMRYLRQLGVAHLVDSKPLTNLGDDIVGDDALRAALHRFTNEAVFQPNKNDMPLWSQDPLGKLVAQFKSYPLMFGRMTKRALFEAGAFEKGNTGETIRWRDLMDQWKDAKYAGNPVPLLALLTVGTALGAGAQYVRDVVQGRNEEAGLGTPGADWHTSKDRLLSKILEKMGLEAFAPDDPAVDQALGWYIEGLLGLGALGMVGDLFYQTASNIDNGAFGSQRIASLFLGPWMGTFNDVVTAGAGAVDAVTGALGEENDQSNAKERAGLRAVLSRVPVAGQIRTLKESVIDATVGPREDR